MQTILSPPLIGVMLLLGGCAQLEGRFQYGSADRVIARSGDYVMLQSGSGDARAMAARYLGSEAHYWMIEDANPPGSIRPGAEVIVPLKHDNPTGITQAGYQTVPVLCYHRFGTRNTKMTISSARFRRQMEYLRDNGYRIIPFGDFISFLNGDRQIPQRALVLTLDDGHRSIYEIAFPILREFGYPATIFVYTDYINNGGLNWKQLKEMIASGLINVQPHSKTHGNLAVKSNGEGDQAYLDRLEREIRQPGKRLKHKLDKGFEILAYAYPFGDANDQVIKALAQSGFAVGMTVRNGGNPAFSYPYLLRRSIVFGDRDLDAFKDLLVTFKADKAQ